MDYNRFMSLENNEIAEIVKENGPKVCVFPINGTRRWFTLEFSNVGPDNYFKEYLNQTLHNHLYLYRLLYDHGIDMLVTPEMGTDTLKRMLADDQYGDLMYEGIHHFTSDAYLNFFDRYDIKVNFYGAYKESLKNTKYETIFTLFEKISEHTKDHTQRKLFMGFFAGDYLDCITKFSCDFYSKNNQYPSKQDLIKFYYGDDVGEADLFIGFDHFTAFDMPLIATGNEILYFMISPSPYMTSTTLRKILYDFIYNRSINDDYRDLSTDSLNKIREFYQVNRDNVLGIGNVILNNKLWIPSSGITDEKLDRI
ncbi:Diterpene synthase [Legionella erythra]|uniref:Diterpene synthase n=2 Tax=Legionella erythra TaxID=448 RepID=A0A0W0TR09_LEGER|nr:Diterpene synthase [Legionella erythra]